MLNRLISLSLLIIFSNLSYADEQTEVIAIVNDKPLTQQDYATYLQARTEQIGKAITPSTQVIIQELINRELIRQDALKQGLDTHPELMKQLELIRDNLLTTLGVRNYLKQHPISEAQLKQAYQTYFVENAPTEYKVHHILVETATEAKQIIEALNAAQSFAKLAQKHSIDTHSAKKQGDLGWLTADKVEPSIAEALQGLKKQNYTLKPVKSALGWHIVFLEDKRQSEPPPFADVKDKLEALLHPQLLKNYIDKLKEQAEIKVLKQIELAQEHPDNSTSTKQTTIPPIAE